MSWVYFLSLSLFSAYSLGLNQSAIPNPHLDLSTLGRVAFTGDFNALSIYNYQNSVLSESGTFFSTNFIRAQLPDGTFMDLAQADASIEQMCAFPTSNNESYVVVAGNFTSIDGTDTLGGIAIFNPSARAGENIIAIPGLQGMVHALLCDQTAATVYIAGSLSGGNSSNAIVFKDSYESLPFKGFNGPIRTMERTSAGTVIFGGTFNGFEDPALNVTQNGLFEYDPNEQPWNTTLQTKVTAIGLKLNVGATINEMMAINDTVVVAGNFSGPGMWNIFSLDKNRDSKTLADGGLNGVVSSLYYLHDQDVLLVGGNFNSTANGSVSGLNNVAGYSFKEARWFALGSGINGPIVSLNRLSLNISVNTPEDIIVVNGYFDEIIAFNNSPAASVKGIGIWVPSKNNWLSNLDMLNKPEFQGELRTSVNWPGEDVQFFAGTISSWVLSATGIIAIGYDKEKVVLGNLGLNLQSQASNGTGNGVTTGLFYVQEGLNITVVGGSFTANLGNDANRSTIHGFAFINGTDHETFNISGRPDFPADSHVQCLETVEHQIFAGGSFQHTILGQETDGLLSFDLLLNEYTDKQPPVLRGPNVSVEVIKARPNSRELYVGGMFDTAGGEKCSTVCVYEMDTGMWRRPGSDIRGSASHMTWTTRDTLIVAGNITIGNTPLSLAAYNSPADQWTPFNELHPLEGIVTAMTPASPGVSGSTFISDSSAFWIAGKDPKNSTFLKKWDGTKWLNVTEGFSNDSTIHNLQILSTTMTHAENQYLGAENLLLLMGNMNLTTEASSYTFRASAAFFNGTAIVPYIFTKNSLGESGTLTSIFVQNSEFFYPGKPIMPCAS